MTDNYGLMLATDILFGIWSIAFLLFAWFDKLPSIETLGKLFSLVNTKGGNITILFVCSILGAGISLRLFYYLIQLSVDGKLQQDNSYALLGLSFMTNTLTGAFIGAMLKTMTGGDKAINDEADNKGEVK